MHEELKMNSQLTTKKINEINQAAARESQEQIRRFIQNLQVENSQTLQNYIQLSTADQKQYIESLLVDFSKYMQEQRNQDLNIMNARLNTLEEDNSLFRQEAGEILTSLITDNNSTVKRN
jgi:PHP family Zn ribbon phosphoesterase